MITEGSFFYHSLLILTHSCPIRASPPVTRDRHLILPPAWKQGTSWQFTFLPSVLLVLHSFRNIGEPLGVWPSNIVCFPFYFFQSPQRPGGGYPKLHIQARVYGLFCLWRDWLMYEARSWLVWKSTWLHISRAGTRLTLFSFLLFAVIFLKITTDMDFILHIIWLCVYCGMWSELQCVPEVTFFGLFLVLLSDHDF